MLRRQWVASAATALALACEPVPDLRFADAPDASVREGDLDAAAGDARAADGAGYADAGEPVEARDGGGAARDAGGEDGDELDTARVCSDASLPPAVTCCRGIACLERRQPREGCDCSACERLADEGCTGRRFCCVGRDGRASCKPTLSACK